MRAGVDRGFHGYGRENYAGGSRKMSNFAMRKAQMKLLRKVK